MIRIFVDVYEYGDNVQSIEFVSFDKEEAEEKMDELYTPCEDHPSNCEWIMDEHKGERHVLWDINIPEWKAGDLGNKPDIRTYRFEELPQTVKDRRYKELMDSLVNSLGYNTDEAKKIIADQLRFMSDGEVFRPMWVYTPQVAAAISDGLYRTPTE